MWKKYDMKNNIETRLRQAIANAPFIPAELARRSGVSPTVISHFIKKNRTLTLTTAAKLADALGLILVHRKRRTKKTPSRKQKGR